MDASDLGTLYICPTPIGNLEDVTERVRRVLSEVSIVAAEDTRHTGRLLSALGVSASLISYHEHNESKRATELIEVLRAGDDIALVSDAGTPGIADPGYRIVVAAVEAGVRVVPLPGPVAATVALSASGLPTDQFAFYGFIPRKGTERKDFIERIALSEITSVFYDTPQRIRRTLQDLAEAIPDRPVVVARELTKRYEEFHRGTAQELARAFPRDSERGEFVLLVGGATEADEEQPGEPTAKLISEQYELLVAHGVDRMEAMKIVACGHGLPKNAVYRIVGA